MAFTSGNDINILQGADALSVGAGAGDDRYVLDASTLNADQQITISDAEGANTLQLAGGLEIVSSQVTGTAVQLVLNNGAKVTVLGANTFNFQTGGNPLNGNGGLVQNFADFVTLSLGLAEVPTDNTPVEGGTVTVQEAGGTGPTEPTEPTEPVLDTYKLAAAKLDVNEGEANTFTVTAIGTDGQPFAVTANTTVTLKVIPGSTTAADQGTDTTNLNDFSAGAFNLVTKTIAAGQSSVSFDVTTLADSFTELTETYQVEVKVGEQVFTKTINVLDGEIGAGKTFTLTAALDNFTGTSGNDTFIGDNSTTTKTVMAGDQLVGGAGNDTLKLYGTAGELPTFSGIETVYLNGTSANTNLSTNADVTAVQLDTVATGMIFTVGANVNSLSVANQAATDTVEFKVAAAATDANVTVNKLGSATAGAVILKLDGAALATVNLTATGTASNVELGDGTAAVADTVTKVTVAGDKSAIVNMNGTTKFALVTTVDASANTAGVTAVLEDTTGANVTVTGGTGNDTANFGDKFDKNDKFDGGAGTDTLEMTQASVTVVQAYAAADKAVVNDNLSNIEVLKVTDALTSGIDASRFDGVNSFVFAAGFNPTGTSTLSSVTSGVSIELNGKAGVATDVLAVEITDATLAGNNSDTVNLTLKDTDSVTAAGVRDFGVLNAVGVDILNISSVKGTDAAGAASLSTGSNIEIAATSSALDKVVVTGNLAVKISDVALVNSIAEVDASGLVVSATTANGLDVAIATGGTNGVKITGSNGVDTLVGGDAADIISAGTGNDSVTGGKGNDVLTGGAGNDTFNFAAGDSGITSTLFDTITDYSNGTVAGTTDKLVFTSAAGVVGTTMTGWTINAGMATKTNATLADFIAAAQTVNTANATFAFVSGSDTYVYNVGANGTTSTADDTLIKLVGVVGNSVVTTDTTVANEIFIG